MAMCKLTFSHMGHYGEKSVWQQEQIYRPISPFGERGIDLRPTLLMTPYWNSFINHILRCGP